MIFLAFMLGYWLTQDFTRQLVMLRFWMLNFVDSFDCHRYLVLYQNLFSIRLLRLAKLYAYPLNFLQDQELYYNNVLFSVKFFSSEVLILVVSVTIVFVQILLYVILIPLSLCWVLYELSMVQSIVQIQSVMWMTLFSIGFFFFFIELPHL